MKRNLGGEEWPKEQDKLMDQYGVLDMPTLQDKLNKAGPFRTVAAIYSRAARMGKNSAQFFTLTDLCKMSKRGEFAVKKALEAMQLTQDRRQRKYLLLPDKLDEFLAYIAEKYPNPEQEGEFSLQDAADKLGLSYHVVRRYAAQMFPETANNPPDRRVTQKQVDMWREKIGQKSLNSWMKDKTDKKKDADRAGEKRMNVVMNFINTIGPIHAELGIPNTQLAVDSLHVRTFMNRNIPIVYVIRAKLTMLVPAQQYNAANPNKSLRPKPKDQAWYIEGPTFVPVVYTEIVE